jgi:hypothetical protein
VAVLGLVQQLPHAVDRSPSHRDSTVTDVHLTERTGRFTRVAGDVMAAQANLVHVELASVNCEQFAVPAQGWVTSILSDEGWSMLESNSVK